MIYNRVITLWKAAESLIFTLTPIGLLAMASYLLDPDQMERVLNNTNLLSPALVVILAPVLTALLRSYVNWYKNRTKQ